MKKLMTLEMFSSLEEANEWLDAIIEHSFDGIYITDGKANTIKANRAYETITGLKKSEVIGCNMEELEQKGIVSASGSLIAIREKRPVTIRQKFKTGKKALITSSPIYSEKGEIVMVVTNVRDLTELYSLREEVEKTKQEEMRLKRELSHVYEKFSVGEQIVAVDHNSLQAFVMADKVAPLDTTVMLLGETGVGKEVFAKYIYSGSRRKAESFIKVNCGAIPENLIESELFGYEKGAFTGADRNGKIGLFEAANNGTIFLDEIGELPMKLQVKLLRVLQEKEIERIGSSRPVKVNVRVIAATNRNLEEMVERKLFREDLYYRLMVFPITIPPLRERREDIIPLALRFLEELNGKYGFHRRFSREASQLMNDYHWPGNIRELRNIVERAVIISSEDEIMSDSLPVFSAAGPSRADKKQKQMLIGQVKDLKTAMEELELEYINQAYEKYGNVRDAAQSLGMTASTFVRKRKRYGADMEEKERGTGKERKADNRDETVVYK